jgi:hypothetical protein
MAVCAKCGAALPSDGPGFCPACGAPVGAAAPAAVPPAAAVPPVYAAAPPAYTAAPPQSSSGGVLKVVLIVIAVVVGLGILGTAAVGFIGYRALHSAGASFSAGNGAQVSTDDLGVDAYPGATHMDQGSMRAKFGGNEMVTSAFTTKDSPGDVVKFYQEKLGDSAVVNQTARGTTLERGTQSGGNSDSLVVTISPSAQDGQTKIIIVHNHASHS